MQVYIIAECLEMMMLCCNLQTCWQLALFRLFSSRRFVEPQVCMLCFVPPCHFDGPSTTTTQHLCTVITATICFPITIINYFTVILTLPFWIRLGGVYFFKTSFWDDMCGISKQKRLRNTQVVMKQVPYFTDPESDGFIALPYTASCVCVFVAVMCSALGEQQLQNRPRKKGDMRHGCWTSTCLLNPLSPFWCILLNNGCYELLKERWDEQLTFHAHPNLWSLCCCRCLCDFAWIYLCLCSMSKKNWPISVHPTAIGICFDARRIGWD